MSSPINVVVSNYPTLAVYYDAEAEKHEVFERMSRGLTAGTTDAERAHTERKIDAVAWKIRWSTQKSGKFETLMGVYNFPTNNLMVTGALDFQGRTFDTSPLVLEKLEALHQEFLSRPEQAICISSSDMDLVGSRPDFDLALSA